MSFLTNNSLVSYGDTVFIYVSHKSIFPQEVAPGRVFQSKFGALRHDDLVGKAYGSKVFCPKGYVYVLRATPDLWTVSLPHRTQILYFADISIIISSLEVRPGAVVVEAGTGSGSMTHSLARTVHPHGRVYTFDFHEKRVCDAREEFKTHGLDHIVSSARRDVCFDGLPDDLDDRVDAVFLDLPHPWKCIPFAKKALKLGGRICCFSPCIEQVQKTQASLRQFLFFEIATCECLLRPFETVKNISLKQLDLEMKNLQSVSSDGMECNPEEKKDEKTVDYTISFPNTAIAGHTGFLTFATKR